MELTEVFGGPSQVQVLPDLLGGVVLAAGVRFALKAVESSRNGARQGLLLLSNFLW